MRKLTKKTAGQTGTEYMLLISVVVIAVVAAAYTYIPEFQAGVTELGTKVMTILDVGCINGCDQGMARNG